MKVVINRCFGGFSISLEAAKHMANAGSKRAAKEVAEHEATLEAFEHYKTHGISKDGRPPSENKFFDINIKYNSLPTFPGYGYVDGMDGSYERDDPLLVSAVETLGKAANGEYASLSVVVIPDGIEWEIDEYDGNEHIAEKHRTWS